jgi:cephalosporin hydroxylase
MSALESCSRESDISDHLSALFYHALEASPRLIVELGTRGGESTRILLAVAEITGGRMLSLDVDDCSGIKVPHADRWEFIRGDDVAFGRDRFVPWCAARGLAPKADVIFIDTSHLYEHTKEELKAWTGHLTDTGTLILHDTNMGDGVYGRHDGSVGLGWNNQRGVIRAVEEFLGRQYNEDKVFSDTAAGFLVKHYPNCNGLTVLKRLPVLG